MDQIIVFDFIDAFLTFMAAASSFISLILLSSICKKCDQIWDASATISTQIDQQDQYKECIHIWESSDMDKEIRRIEKGVKHTEKELKSLEKADKKRDKVCDLGKKIMKKKSSKK